mmetsp:Transcript_34639/g.52987  ORF Transcript_34639/g.52987 Transcript_34639/m.52987 type:complete len:190 (-) Transcript_34639:1032-1601(-)
MKVAQYNLVNQGGPIDIEQVMPPERIPREISYVKFHQMMKRRIRLKNIVLKIIFQRREKIKKVDVSQILVSWKDKAENNLIRNLVLFETLDLFPRNKPQLFHSDKKYARLKTTFDRQEKVLQMSKEVLDKLYRQVGTLQRRRNQRESMEIGIKDYFMKEIKKAFMTQEAKVKKVMTIRDKALPAAFRNQ